MVCDLVGLTAFAVHVSVTLTVQHSMFVSDSIQQNGNSNKRVTAIGYPRHTLAPTLTLLLHQLRQTLPQLLLLAAADTGISSTNTQCDSFKMCFSSFCTLTQPIPAFHSWWNYTKPAGARNNKRGILHSPQMSRNIQIMLKEEGCTFRSSLGKSLPLLRPSRLLINCWQDIFFPMFCRKKQNKNKAQFNLKNLNNYVS